MQNFDTYQSKTELILPFNGAWKVSNGGRDAKLNGHRTPNNDGSQNQMFAYDFIKDNPEKGDNLEVYEAFGAEVIAPGRGIIVQIIDGSFDMPIGESDWVVLCGNMVVIDHENGDWSVLAHLKHNSIIVKVGDIVKQGELLGLCGNSGNTSEPHIHYHLQNNLLQQKAMGLPAQFRNIVIDGQDKKNYEPVMDQKVSNNR